MSTPQFIDVSNYQKSVDWPAYKKWAASFDGVSRVAIKSSEGEGYTDPSFAAHRAGALAAGIDEIWLYHFARPGLGNTAIDEANSMQHIIGAIRAQDRIVLDMEEAMPQANSAWALAWLEQQQHNYGKPPMLYSYLSYIQTRLQDPRLANYPLWLAAFSYDATARPACPKPWTSYAALQYSDKATIPGIAGAVDANVYLLAPASGVTPMAELTSFPLVSQLTATTSDGRPSENAQFDCVAASIGAGLLWYMGKSKWDQSMNPDLLKDKAYGEAFRNSGTAASAYIPYCASLGYKLYPVSGNVHALVQQAHVHIKAGHPVIFTEPDPYAAASLGWSHVCVFFKEIAGGLVALDPYVAKAIQRNDSDWAGQLRFGQIWILEKVGKKVMDITDKALAAYYKVVNGTLVHDTFTIHGAILTHYLTTGGLAELGLPLSNEIVLDAVKYPGAVYQRFERGVVYYDPKHLADDPPGTSGDACYRGHIDVGAGVDPRIADLQKQIDALKATTGKVDTTQLENDLQGLANALPPAFAKILADVKALAS